MTIYEEAALYAYKLIVEKNRECNDATWEEAVAKYSDSIHTQQKGCPKGAFLGLCSEGLLKSISSGHYTGSLLNKEYAVKAYEILKENPKRIDEDPRQIWREICGDKAYSHQVHIVFALWREECFQKQNRYFSL